MTNTSASLFYRRAATQQASTVGLVIALYDTLAGDLQRAIEAIERKDIPARCEQLSHGFKVLHHLELMIDHQNGGKTAANLQRFYKHIRGQMLDAQFKLSPNILRTQIRIVLEVREAWQKMDAGEMDRKQATPSKAESLKYTQNEAATRISFSC